MVRTKMQETELVSFVRKTTQAITIMAESTRELGKTTKAIQESLAYQSTTNAQSFEEVNGKMDGLLTMFKYVIVPLVTGILALVGIKMIFKL